MADPVQGKLEVQTDSGDQTRIVLDPAAAEVVAGGDGANGDLVVKDVSDNEVIRIGRIQEHQTSSGSTSPTVIASYTGIRVRTSDGENLVQIGRTASAQTIGEKDDIGIILGGKGLSARLLIVDKDKKTRILLGQDYSDNDGRFIIQSPSGKKILEFDPDAAALYVGAEDDEGDVIVRDGEAHERIKLDGGAGDVSVDDADGHRLLHFDCGAAALYVGGTGNEGDVIVRDEQDRERIKLDGGRGDIRATDQKGTRVFHFDSGLAALYVGGTGNEGDVIVRDEQDRERIKLDGGHGDIWVDDAAGNRLLHFRNEFAALYVGGNGTEGDVIVRNGDGAETIKLDGGQGDIILSNADCAEEFDVAEDAPPGSVMVIDDDERLTPSTTAYDRRVAGVVSGAGEYRPGIVLGRQADAGERPAIALAGKVYCRVDATHGPVESGDLLVSSPTPGHAMRAADAARWPGAVLGKALRALPDGRGLVPILVTLQ